MAELFVFGIAKTVLVKVGSVAVRRMCSAWDLENARNDLEETLFAIKAVLRDAEEKQASSNALRDWLGKLRDVCHDADDMLEEFEYQALLLRLANEGNITTNLHIFFSGSNSVLLRFTMADKIKGIGKRLNKIAKDRDQFNLREVMEPRVTRRVLPYCLVAPNVIGRDEDKALIVPVLIDSLHGDKEMVPVSVLPIVGLGGLGKTTLARYVYGDKEIVRHFWLRMWACLSKESDLEKLIRTITDQALRENEKKSGKQLAMGATTDNLDTEQLQSLLRDILKENIFLLVLDDVWDMDNHIWVDLKNLLMDGARGSKIIVTTRSDKVASTMGTIVPYKLEGLQHQDCLSLFLSIAFKKGEKEKHPELVKIGDEIVKKCKGVPLAARTLGSLLCSEFNKSEWIRVRDNDIWKLEQQEDDILPALRVSYEQLPPHLRYCFAYCSIFPKGTIFRSTSLIQLWIAQGLIQPSNESQNQDLEDIGDQYLNYLSARSFFQDVEDFDFFRQFKMHDLVHDLALFVAQTECALIDSPGQTIPRTVRHVSFCERDCQERPLPSVLLERNNPRTILFPSKRSIDGSFVIDCISSFKSMRVLDLSDLDFGAMPDLISTLQHLRYLSLRGNKSMKTLPNSICKLLNLQTLLLGGCWELEELPKDLGYMINLKHLEITTKQKAFPKKGKETEFFNSLRFLSIFRCQNMEVLFGGKETLAALRTLVILDCTSLVSLPHNLKRLGALKNLIIFNSTLDLVLDGEDVGEGFGSLNLLVIRKLLTLQILPLWIQNLRSLETLRIKDCPQLSTLPEEMHLLTSLKTLEIVHCPQLSKRCEPEKGEDWHKIVHVSDIYLDGQKIKSSTNED